MLSTHYSMVLSDVEEEGKDPAAEEAVKWSAIACRPEAGRCSCCLEHEPTNRAVFQGKSERFIWLVHNYYE